MKELQVFKILEFGQVRMIEIDGKAYFVAIDIAKALGYKDPNSAITRHLQGVGETPSPDKWWYSRKVQYTLSANLSKPR